MKTDLSFELELKLLRKRAGIVEAVDMPVVIQDIFSTIAKSPVQIELRQRYKNQVSHANAQILNKMVTTNGGQEQGFKAGNVTIYLISNPNNTFYAKVVNDNKEVREIPLTTVSNNKVIGISPQGMGTVIVDLNLHSIIYIPLHNLK